MSEEFDTWRTSHIICPYCGYEDKDSWEYTESGEIFCGECGKTFHMEREVDIKYSTYTIEHTKQEK